MNNRVGKCHGRRSGCFAAALLLFSGGCTPPTPAEGGAARADAPRPEVAPATAPDGPPQAVVAGSPATFPDISVVDGDWGDASREDIAAVLHSTARCFDEAIAERPVDPLLVGPSPAGADYPITLDEASDGRTRIRLAVRDRRWAQLAFQFAHEFCHALSNHRVEGDRRFGWIRECLCETASLHALRTMARTWKESPPYPNWREYAPRLGEYADERCAQPEHRLPDGIAFPAWLAAQLPALTADSARRADNVVVAQHLLPVFERHPEAWRAVRYLNLWDTSEDSSIEEYFAHWRSAAPDRLRAVISSIERRLAEP